MIIDTEVFQRRNRNIHIPRGTSVIRFKIDEKIEIKWVDQIRGEIKWQGKDLGGDLVLSRRAKGYEIGDPLYNLAVVVDDNFMNITHVVRVKTISRTLQNKY